MQEVKSLSPSQIGSYLLCPRKWYFNKVEGVPEPQSKKQGLGQNYHSDIENYLTHGTAPKYESVKLILLDALTPKPGPGLLVEQPQDYNLGLTAGGLPMRGRIDLLDPRTKHLRVIDWKSTSSKQFRYALSKEDFTKDPQNIVYTEHAFQKYSPETVTFSHGYLYTSDDEPDYRYSSTEPQTREESARRYADLERVAEAMVATGRRASAADVEGHYRNEEADPDYEGKTRGDRCYKYGPCAYMDRCKALTRSDADEFFAFAGAEPVKDLAAELLGTPVTAPSTDLLIYVDCGSTKTPGGIRLADLIAERSEPIAKKYGVTDVRQADFGKGVADLVASFKLNPPRGVVLATNAPLQAMIVEALTPIAKDVIR